MAWGEGPAGVAESLGPDLFGDPSTSHLVITLLQVVVTSTVITSTLVATTAVAAGVVAGVVGRLNVGCGGVGRGPGGEAGQGSLSGARLWHRNTTKDLHGREGTSLRPARIHNLKPVDNAGRNPTFSDALVRAHDDG